MPLRLTRRRFVALAVPAVGGVAGCSGPATGIENREVVDDARWFAVDRLEEWAAGTALEFGGELVVDGTLRNEDDRERPVPVVTAAFVDADGTERAAVPALVHDVAARRDPEENAWREHDEAAPVPAGETVDFRAVFEPAGDDVTAYDLVVADAATERAGDEGDGDGDDVPDASADA